VFISVIVVAMTGSYLVWPRDRDEWDTGPMPVPADPGDRVVMRCGKWRLEKTTHDSTLRGWAPYVRYVYSFELLPEKEYIPVGTSSTRRWNDPLPPAISYSERERRCKSCCHRTCCVCNVEHTRCAMCGCWLCLEEKTQECGDDDDDDDDEVQVCCETCHECLLRDCVRVVTALVGARYPDVRRDLWMRVLRLSFPTASVQLLHYLQGCSVVVLS